MNENKEMGGQEPVDEHGRTEKEAAEYLAYCLEKYAEPVILKNELKDCEPDIITLEQMFVAFERDHPLAELYAITDLSLADALNHPIRQPAVEAIKPIGLWLAYLEKETNITPERHAALLAHYAELTKAVGIIITAESKVRHEYDTNK